MSPNRTVVIAGGGLVGRTIAIAIACQSHLGVRLVAGPPPRPDKRASAVSAGGRQLLTTIGVWPMVAEEAQPIREMVLTDSRADDTIRPEVLTFTGEDGEAAFAHMVPNETLREALDKRCQALGIAHEPQTVRTYEESETGLVAELSSGATIEAAVLVACDGRDSRLRAIAGIGVVDKGYAQSSVVGTVSHALPHNGRATQHFLPGGPFAMLPLKGNASSIVWTAPSDFARSLIDMEPMIASLEIERVFGLSLGRLCVEDYLQVHPLRAMLARELVAGRLALAGDAAHVIHPLAGQGLNLGLRDAAALTQVLVEADRLGQDPAAELSRYQRWRRADTLQMAFATDALNAIFSRRSDLMRSVRSIGLGLLQRGEVGKARFIAEATGLTGSVPRLMRGEAL